MTAIIIGLLIPLLGAMLGSAFVFLMKDEMSARMQKSLLGFASGVMEELIPWWITTPKKSPPDDMHREVATVSVLNSLRLKLKRI